MAKDIEEKRMERLTGKFKHYCVEWDYMAIDEYCPEFDACLCFNKEEERNDLDQELYL